MESGGAVAWLRGHRPGHGTVVAYLALFVALGGSSYAAIKLPKDAVKQKNIAANAVTSAKVKDRSLAARDFATNELPQGPQGDVGPAGPRGDTGPAGRNGERGGDGRDGLSFTWRGEWDRTAAYDPRDAVARNGSSFIATAPSTGDNPPDAPARWQLLASKGDPGRDGQDGAPGAPGQNGTSFVWKGVWQAGTTYHVQDAVSHNGSSYIAKGITTNADPASSPAAWELMAQKGSDAQFNGAVAGGDLSGSYPNPEIGPGKVESDNVFDGTLTADDLAGGAVTTAKFAPTAKAPDADRLDGKDATDFLTPQAGVQSDPLALPTAQTGMFTGAAGVSVGTSSTATPSTSVVVAAGLDVKCRTFTASSTTHVALRVDSSNFWEGRVTIADNGSARAATSVPMTTNSEVDTGSFTSGSSPGATGAQFAVQLLERNVLNPRTATIDVAVDPDNISTGQANCMARAVVGPA
jgi:hypothetical protein